MAMWLLATRPGDKEHSVPEPAPPWAQVLPPTLPGTPRGALPPGQGSRVALPQEGGCSQERRRPGSCSLGAQSAGARWGVPWGLGRGAQHLPPGRPGA